MLNITGLLEEGLTYENRLRSVSRIKRHFYVSDLGRCKRKMYYSLTGEPKTRLPDAQGIMKMEAGKAIEDVVCRAIGSLAQRNNTLAAIGKEIELPAEINLTEPFTTEEQKRLEERITDNRELHGYADLIVHNKRGSFPVEIKSYYGYYQGKDIRAGKPNRYYVFQLAGYMHFFGMPLGYLLFVSREDMKIDTFEVSVENGEIYVNNGYDSVYYGDMCNLLYDMVRVDTFINNKTLPPMDHFYKWIAADFEKEAKKWSASKVRTELKSLMPISQVKSEPDGKGKRKILGYDFEGILYPKKEEAEKACIGRLEKGMCPQVSAVHGDFECKYCDYKETCLKAEGIELGYNSSEILDRVKILKGLL